MSKRTYHVCGSYAAVYKDGRHAGTLSYSGEQEAEDGETAIRQAAGDEMIEHNYVAFMWLYAEAEPVGPDP